MASGVDPSADAGQQLALVEELLAALSLKHDVGDLVQHLSTVICRILSHLTRPSSSCWPMTEPRTCTPERRWRVRRNRARRGTRPSRQCRAAAARVRTATERGLQSGLKVPVKIDDRVRGVLALFSRSPQGYSPSDLLYAERLANCLGHRLAYQRLAEQAREAAVERQRAAEIESSVELLRTISDVLDIRTVFPRVSEIANKMLPHDALAMVFVDRDRHFVRQAASPPDFPDPPVGHGQDRQAP